ncbi:hypothetical protein B0H19DRAFT_1070614 [Mycena capillaripes]|nr:hypothetical protein B0H19DRAFT_1070614 [Mycena capillaripes]
MGSRNYASMGSRRAAPWFTPGNTFSVLFFILGLFGAVCEFYITDDGWCTKRSSMGTTLPGFVGGSLIALIDRNTDGGDARNRTWGTRWRQLMSLSWFTPGNTLFAMATTLGAFGIVCQFYTDEDGWCSTSVTMGTGISGFVGAAVIAFIDRTTDGGDSRNRSWAARWRQVAALQRACVSSSRGYTDLSPSTYSHCLEEMESCLGQCCCCTTRDRENESFLHLDDD